MSLADRIKRYAIPGPAPDDCIGWSGTKSTKGYAELYVCGDKIRVSHIVLQIDGRPLGPGQVATHSCNNPGCINGKHLIGATPQENTNYMVLCGRAWWQRSAA
jgi:hypothetical protein